MQSPLDIALAREIHASRAAAAHKRHQHGHPFAARSSRAGSSGFKRNSQPTRRPVARWSPRRPRWARPA